MEDDARFTLAVARTALAAGRRAVAVTRVRATGLRPTRAVRRARGARRRRTCSTGRRARDPDPRRHRRDRRLGRRARPPVRELVDAHPAQPRRPPRRAARADPGETGLTIRVPGKIVFLVPWPDHWLIGTTDAPYDGPPTATAADRLGGRPSCSTTVNATMDVDLTRADVVGTYAGLRPLIAPSGGSTVKASREHRVTAEPNGVVRIGGGKYTTYRVMARDVIDAALGREARARPSAHGRPPLIGAAEHDRARSDRRRARDDPGVAPAHPEAAARLVARHGTEAPASSRSAPSWTSCDRSSPGRPFLEAEVAWAVRHELALSVDDVLSRRTAARPELAATGAAVASRVAAILGASSVGGRALESSVERQRDRRRASIRAARDLTWSRAGGCRRRFGAATESRGCTSPPADPRTIPPANATEASVAKNVARRNSDSSHG